MGADPLNSDYDFGKFFQKGLRELFAIYITANHGFNHGIICNLYILSSVCISWLILSYLKLIQSHVQYNRIQRTVLLQKNISD